MSFSQEVDKKLDSLENVLFDMGKNQPDSLIEIGNQILKETKSKEQKARILGALAVAYFEKNDINKSTELLFEAKNTAISTKNHELIAKIYGSIAHQYIHLNLNDRSKFYLAEAIEHINLMPDGNNKLLLKGLSYIELGNVEFKDKNYINANQNYKESLVHFEKMMYTERQSEYHYRRSLYNIGNSFTYINQPDSAEIYLNKVLEIKRDKKDGLIYFIYNAFARVYNQKEDYQRAIDTLEIILEDNNFKDIRLRSDIYHSLAENYKEMGENERYFFYNEKHNNLNSSIRDNNFKAINSAIDTEQKDYLLALSDADKNNRFILFGSLFFLITLLLSIVYLLLKRKKEKIIYEKLILSLREKLKFPIAEKNPIKTSKNEGTLLPNTVEENILLKLIKFEESEKFINSKLTISTLALQLKTNTSYLSETINNFKGKNFNAYINELRIKYICKKIYENPEYLTYKISYLAEISGFTSHSAFATVFKSVTGISPSAFLRESAKNKKLANQNF